ncbi:hypothetical protein VPH35_099170 [Triticum aestivum]|uniref:HTH La-type RNA-binding domain-containing protein n=1 Tax=Triticum aestivum TaxID=4565 RepID=A0A3B6MX97_WHEAT|nr:la-related protein 1B-like [Triticum aestivum]
MSPAAGGAAPTQPAATAGLAPAAIAAPPQAPSRVNPRDPAAQAEGADPGNAAARKTAWNVPPPPPAPVGGIMGGDESWPALADAAARAWPKSSSSDSLKSLSDGSAPSPPEDPIVPLVPPQPQLQPVSTPISAASSPGPASTSPPPSASATTTASSPQNGSTSQPILVRHGGGNGGNNGGGGDGNVSTHSQSTGNYSSDGNSSSGGDGNWNDGGLSGGNNLNSSVHSGAIGGRGIDNSRRVFGSNNWNGNGRGGGSYNNATGSGDGGNRYNGGSGSGHWNNNARHGSGNSNGFGGRGGRNRRDHERGSNFSPRGYSRTLPVQQQQPGYYQPGPFQRPPPPSPAAAHFMVPQPFVPYVQPIPYPADLQASYPYYVTQVEQQFQNMHLIRPPMQPLAFQQDQINLQRDIQLQIEHYFSTNNLCHDTYLRERMDDQGWVPIDLIASFPMLTRFTMLGIDTNYILDSIRGSELLEVQGNNVRRRNDWAAWLLHRGPPPSN